MKKNSLAFLVALILMGCGKTVVVNSVDFYKAHDAERKSRMAECNKIVDGLKDANAFQSFQASKEGMDCNNANDATQALLMQFKDPSKGRTYLGF